MTTPPDHRDLRFLGELGDELERAERDLEHRPSGVLWRVRAQRGLRGPLLAVVLVLAMATGVAAATGVISTTTPPPKPLAQAIHDAMSGPQVEGVSARIRFTNRLIDSSGVAQGSDPLLAGSTGRLWATPGGDVRLELQSSGGGGDAQILLRGDQLSIYHAAANTVYRMTLPQHTDSQASSKEPWPPSLDGIRRALERLSAHASLSDATPTNIAGRPAYSLRLAPLQHGGLVGGAEIAWDAVNGAPLRAGIYAKGDSSPVLQLEATRISFGPVPASVFDLPIPAGAQVVDLQAKRPSAATGPSKPAQPVSGLPAVQAQLPFTVAAPDTLAGMARSEVRLISGGGHAGALVTYGQGLDGIAVLQLPDTSGGAQPGGEHTGLSLPSVTIGSVRGQELTTALGTVVTFSRGGVRYTVMGSVIPATVEAAARAL
ncbi:MAG TPA: hypothetical protein VMT10_08530 [Solirubrobacteraceae bacterium]|nr:hypothetical protein [Solirubrobacteraceae bacterium]